MAAKAALSEEEYLRTSFPGTDEEYRDGELLERSVPTLDHGTVQANLILFFGGRKKTHRLFPSPETRHKVRPGRYIIPDVAVYWPERPKIQVPDTCPLVAIEILSPDDRMAIVREKLGEYVEWGVPHVWLVDPILKRLYICREELHEVRSYVLPEVSLTLTIADIFED